MAITSAARRVNAGTANGTNRSWPFSLKYFFAAHLRVYVLEDGVQTEVVAANYTLTPGSGNEIDGFAGGTITYPKTDPALTDGDIIVETIVPYTQTNVELNLVSGFDPRIIEREFDLSVMRDQQLRDGVVATGVVKTPLPDDDITLPAPGANLVFGWNAAGTAIENKTPTTAFAVGGNGAIAQSAGGTGATALDDALITVDGGTETRTLAERLGDDVTPFDFGAAGDGVTDDLAAIQAAIDYGAANGVRVRILKGTYRVTDLINTRSNLHLEFEPGAWIKPDAWPSGGVGALLTNVIPGTTVGRTQSNIRIVNPQLDGEDLPYDLVSNCSGLAFASDVTNVEIVGGTIRNFLASHSGGGAGGKGVAVDTGGRNVRVTGTYVENCHVGFFVNGKDGLNGNGMAQDAAQIIFANVQARDCDAAVFLAGLNTSDVPDGDAGEMLVLVDGLTFWDCGHAPDRDVGGVSNQKSGAICFGEAQNVTVRNWKGYNSPGYPASWPVDTDLVGGGLTGPIGSPIWGWGRNIVVENGEYHGDCDHLVSIIRARALGDDAGGTQNGRPENCTRFDVRGLRHYGEALGVVALDASPTFRVLDAELTGFWTDIYPDTITAGLIDATAASHGNVRMQVIDPATNRILDGPFSALRASTGANNTFASPRTGTFLHGSSFGAARLEADRFNGKSYTLEEDTATSFTPTTVSGVLVISSEASLLRAIVGFRCDATPQCTILGPAISNFAVTTGALTGLTGAGSTFTVSAHTDGKLYFENQRGAEVTFTVTLLG